MEVLLAAMEPRGAGSVGVVAHDFVRERGVAFFRFD